MEKNSFKFEKLPNAPVSDKELISDLKRVFQKVTKGKVSQSIYSRKGQYDCSTIIRRFGTWNSALKKLGIGLSNEVNISDERLFENLLNLWQKFGRQPRRSDLAGEISKFSQSPYNRRFKTWTNALKNFIEYANDIDKKVISVNEVKSGKRKTGRDPSLRLRFKVMKRDSFSCKQCGSSPAKNTSVELYIDHIVPWSKGGETVLENLQTLCSKCNIGKSNIE